MAHYIPRASSAIFGRISQELYKVKWKSMSKPKLLLLSSSRVHGFEFLEYATSDIIQFLNKFNVRKVSFVPYAAIDHDAYLAKVAPVFEKWGYQLESIHRSNPTETLRKSQAIFVGGGNTFLLLKTLYDQKLVDVIRKRVLEDGIPYIGSSAGTNIAAPTIHNTNDMPIVYPPSFNALKLLPFNINPHYIDPDTSSKHKGETREERILQYHDLPPHYPVYNVLGLREGCTLCVEGETAVLKGISNARLFIRGCGPQEITVGSDLSHLFPRKEEVQVQL